MSNSPISSSENHNTRTRDLLAASIDGNISELQRLLPVVNIPSVWDKAFEHAGTGGHLECLKELNAYGVSDNVRNKALQAAAQQGHEACVRWLVEGADPNASESKALRRAAEHGRFDIVKFLVAYAPQKDIQRGLVKAAWEGHAPIVALLLDHCISDHTAEHNEALYRASSRGHVDIVTLLLPVADPLDQFSRCLLRATVNGHMDCVQLLLPHSDPQANDSRVLAEAFLYEQWDLFELLYPHCNATVAERFIPVRVWGPNIAPSEENIREKWNAKVALMQHKLLNAHVAPCAPSAASRKM